MGHDASRSDAKAATDHLPLAGPRTPAGQPGRQLDGFTVHAGPTTTLTGPVTDAADLYGLIARLECLGLTLLSIQPSTSSTTSRVGRARHHPPRQGAPR